MRKNNDTAKEEKKVSSAVKKDKNPEVKAEKKAAKKAKRQETREILKEITWPGPLLAVKYTIYCGIASVVVAGVIYLYQYGISELVSKVL